MCKLRARSCHLFLLKQHPEEKLLSTNEEHRKDRDSWKAGETSGIWKTLWDPTPASVDWKEVCQGQYRAFLPSSRCRFRRHSWFHRIQDICPANQCWEINRSISWKFVHVNILKEWPWGWLANHNWKGLLANIDQ